jgi:TolA-binding protein
VLLIPFVLAGCFKTRDEIAREKEDQEVRSTLQQNIVDYNQTLDRLQGDMGKLQGRIDELEHQRKKEMSGLAASQDNEQKSTQKAIQELTAKIGALQDAQNALFEEVKKMREDSLNERARPAPAPAGAKKKGIGASYGAALSAYKGRDYAGAIAGFRAYLEADPKSKRALEARYYLADSLFKQKSYQEAVVEFGAVRDKAPATFFGRRSTLRLAQSFKAMGKVKDAHAFAQLLVQESPASAEARTARKMLK